LKKSTDDENIPVSDTVVNLNNADEEQKALVETEKTANENFGSWTAAPSNDGENDIEDGLLSQ